MTKPTKRSPAPQGSAYTFAVTAKGSLADKVEEARQRLAQMNGAQPSNEAMLSEVLDVFLDATEGF